MAQRRLFLFRVCPWPRDSSEVLDLSNVERMAYVDSKNQGSVTINGLTVPDQLEIHIPNVPTGAMHWSTKIQVDPAIINYYSYAIVGAGDAASMTINTLFFYWIDSVNVIKRDTVNNTCIAEINCSIDLWSQYGRLTELHNSLVATQTVDRWVSGDEKHPIYYPCQEGTVGSQCIIASTQFREYIDYTDGQGNFYPASDRKYFAMYGVIYGTKNISEVVSTVVSGITIGIYCDDGTTISAISDASFQDWTTSDWVKMVRISAFASGSLLSDLKIGSNNSTLLNAELIPPLGLVLSAAYVDYTARITFIDGYLFTQAYFDDSSTYKMIEFNTGSGIGSYVTYHQIDMQVDLFAHAAKPGTHGETVEVGMPYRDWYEPMNYQKPFQELRLVDACGGLLGTFADENILKQGDHGELQQFTTQACFDISTTSTNVLLGYFTDHSIGDMSVAYGVSAPASKANVADSQQLIYRNTQYNADRQLHSTQQICTAINAIAGIGKAAAGGAIAGGSAGAVGMAAGEGAAQAPSLLTGWMMSDAQWKHDQTVIANAPNTVLFSGGVDAAIRAGGVCALVQTRVDPVTWQDVRNRHYLKGIDINTMITGTVNLHHRVGFDYIQCHYARVKLSAPGDIQLAMKRLFESGIRIYHRTDFFEQDKSDLYSCMENFEVALLPEVNNDT